MIREDVGNVLCWRCHPCICLVCLSQKFEKNTREVTMSSYRRLQ